MGIKTNRWFRHFIIGEAANDDVEEKEVWFRDGEEEGTRVARGFEGWESVGEFCDCWQIVLEAVDDDLGVRLSELWLCFGAF